MLKLNKCISISFICILIPFIFLGCSSDNGTFITPTITPDLFAVTPNPYYGKHPYQDIINAVKAIQPAKAPDHLATHDGQRTSDDFDISEYFTILTNISVKEGYTLDYVYHFDGSAGYPVFYIRELSQEPYPDDDDLYNDIGLTSAYQNHDEELQQSIESGETLNWQKSIVVNDTEQGFFEYLILKIIGGQFYLWWHGGYNDLTFVCNHSAVQAVITEVQKYYKISADTIYAASQLDLSPKVEFTDDIVTISAVFFTKWGGFRQGTFTISRDFPHIIISTEWETLVEYDCGGVI